MGLGMCWPNQDRPSLALALSSLTSRGMGSTVASESASRLSTRRPSLAVRGAAQGTEQAKLVAGALLIVGDDVTQEGKGAGAT